MRTTWTNSIRTIETQEIEDPILEDTGPPEDQPNGDMPDQQSVLKRLWSKHT